MRGQMEEINKAMDLLREVLVAIQLDGDLAHVNVAAITMDDDLEALGIDSVARLDIILALEERVGFELVPDPDSDISSIREVLDLLGARSEESVA